MQTQISSLTATSAPLSTASNTLAYTIKNQRAVVSLNSKTYIITERNPKIFYYLQEELIGLEQILDFAKSPRAKLNDFLESLGESETFLDEAPRPILDFLQNIRENGSNLPITPVLAFLRKALSIKDKAQVRGLLEYFQSSQVLTWDGNLIAYARASWLGGSDDIGVIGRDFQAPEPGKVLKADSKLLMLGSLDWASDRCPDQGILMDFEVNPGDFQGLDSLGRIKVTQAVMISHLSEGRYPQEQPGVFVVNTHVSDHGAYKVRSPYSPDSVRSYLEQQFSSSQLTGSGKDVYASLTGSC